MNARLTSSFLRTLRHLAVGLLLAPLAWADGTLTHLSGPVSIQKADGKTLPGAVGAKVLPGDTVITGANAFVRMEMTDGGEMILRPDSQLKIEAYQYKPEKPAEDSSVFSMLKGGLRTVTGLIGKRGNKDAYEMKTNTATIGIRGTQYDMRVCAGNCGAMADGTYLAVRFGAVQASNAQGSLPVAAGQVAHVPPKLPPVILPRDPGIGFTPPATMPKLDEKKKVQASQAAATPTPEQPKPASTTTTTQPAADKPAPVAEKPASNDSTQGSPSGGGGSTASTASNPSPTTTAASTSAPTTGTPAPVAGEVTPTPGSAPSTQPTAATPPQTAGVTSAPASSTSLTGLTSLASPFASPATQPAGIECSIQ